MDYYEILGLKPNATKPKIKEAFKKLAMKFHPDKHSGSSKWVQESATLKFKQVSEAYQVLTNDSKRADYDSRYGSSRGNRGSGFASTSTSYGGSYGYSRSRYGTGDYDAFREGYRHRYASGGSDGGLGFGAVVRFLSSPVVLISIAFASVMVATTFIIDKGNDRLRKMHDYEKCKQKYFEEIEAMRREDLRPNHRARGRPKKAHSYYYHYPPRGDDTF